MSESVSLPALGESVTEGTVTRWLKNVGDRVEVDEPLLEVSTDKVDTEIPSPIAGVIEAILVQEDETVEVGTPLVTISDGADVGTTETAVVEAPAEAEPVPAPTPEPAETPSQAAPAEAVSAPEIAEAPDDDVPVDTAPTAPVPVVSPAPVVSYTPPIPVAAPTPTPSAITPAPAPVAPAAPTPAPSATPPAPTAAAPAPSSGGAHAGAYVTPIVRKIAAEQGVDLGNVTGTGVGGRIRKDDILHAAAAAEFDSVPSAPAQAAPAAAVPVVSPLRGTTVTLSRLRKVIADRAVASMQSTAQLTTVVEADVTRIAVLRDRVKAEFLAQTGAKLSFLPFFALAAVEALKTYPIINSTVEGDSIVYPDHENLSIAVDTERGLLTPVVRDASDKNIAQLALEIADLAERTRDNRLKPDELAGGTFTLTNTGSRGALFDTPLVFLPQVAILGTGAVVKKPAVVTVDGQEAIAVRSIVSLALSYDHRIVDGADAARYLSLVKQRVEAGAFEANLGISIA